MDKSINYNGSRIHYRVIGSGQPVVLVHGFAETGEVWDSQVDFFKPKFLLIVPDLPGSGRSEMVSDMSIEGMAEVVKAIIDEEKKSQTNMQNSRDIIFIGHSMGGYITLAFVEKYEHYLKAFGLFHSTAFADSDEKKTARKKSIDFIQKNGAFEFIKSTTPNLFSPVTKEKTPELIEQFVAGLNNFYPDALVSYYEAMMQRPDRIAILKMATMPVLFVMGKYDNAVPLEDGLKQCHLPENSYIHILHESGHMGMIEQSLESNRLLEVFFPAM
jgi:pimeloyl-ACP methyl ester carboxylesterase